MGVLYQRYEAIRRIIIKNFPENKIIIFPQTIDYGKTKYGIKEMNKSENIYNNHQNLTIMAREQKSYNVMKKLYYNCNVLFTPDIVLFLSYKDFHKINFNRVGICLRNDAEKIVNDSDKLIIENLNMKKNYISTVENFDFDINIKNRESVVLKKLHEVAENELFITDRLHGMIFAYITGTPCIALPNSNGKTERVFEWIKNCNFVFFEKKLAPDFLDEFKNMNYNEVKFANLETVFNQLSECI